LWRLPPRLTACPSFCGAVWAMRTNRAQPRKATGAKSALAFDVMQTVTLRLACWLIFLQLYDEETRVRRRFW
jgi:hypothetical protein